MPSPNIYSLAEKKSNEIEGELKRLNRWDDKPLPADKFKDMGAFGSNTMTFVQWLQFVLILRIRQIVSQGGDFPNNSMVGTYAIREFDGDHEAGRLKELLCELDEIVNGAKEDKEIVEASTVGKSAPPDTISGGDSVIPPVVYTLASLLPQFEGDDLESQLQSYDTFIAVLPPTARKAISDLLKEAAKSTSNPCAIDSAAFSIRALLPGLEVDFAASFNRSLMALRAVGESTAMKVS